MNAVDIKNNLSEMFDFDAEYYNIGINDSGVYITPTPDNHSPVHISNSGCGEEVTAGVNFKSVWAQRLRDSLECSMAAFDMSDSAGALVKLTSNVMQANSLLTELNTYLEPAWRASLWLNKYNRSKRQ